MADPIGDVWAMKSGDFQPTNFASTGTGIQAALDYCSSPGGEVYIGPGTISGIGTLACYGWTTIRGAGPKVTILQRSASSTGNGIQEKTAAQGNPYGAAGVVIKDLTLDGNGSSGDGINLGNQGGASFTSNAYLSDVFSGGFPSGSAVKLLANAIHIRDVWAIGSKYGLWLDGGANHVSGLWAENNTVTGLKIPSAGSNTFNHCQFEDGGIVHSRGFIDIGDGTAGHGSSNVFFGIYMAVTAAQNRLINEQAGCSQIQYFGVVTAVSGGGSYNHVLYNETWSRGTGVLGYIPFYVDTANSLQTHFYNKSTNGLLQISAGTITGDLTETGNLTVTGNVTTGTAGVGSSATIGQGTTGADSSTVTARSGTGGIAQFLLNQNGSNLAGFRVASSQTFIDTVGGLTVREGISGTQNFKIGSGGAFNPKTEQALVDAATVAVDASTGMFFKVTLTAARIIGSPTNASTGQVVYFRIIQDGTGGWALTWNAVFKKSWSDTGNTAGKFSTIGFQYDGTNWNQIGAQSPYI